MSVPRAVCRNVGARELCRGGAQRRDLRAPARETSRMIKTVRERTIYVPDRHERRALLPGVHLVQGTRALFQG